MYLKPAVEVDYPSFVPLEIQQSSTSVNSLLEIEGLGTKGGEELQENNQEKLIESVLAKSPESSTSQISINKFLEKIWYSEYFFIGCAVKKSCKISW